MLTRECDLKIVSLDPCGFIDGLACIVKLFVVSSMRHLPSTLMKEALCVCVFYCHRLATNKARVCLS